MTDTKEILGNVILTEAQIQERVCQLGQTISNDYEGESVLFVCILKGACMFLGDLIKRVNLDARIDFMSVSSYGSETISAGVVQINKDVNTDIEGKNVILVEDIIDTGLTLHSLVERLWERNPKSIRICTLLDKPERRKVEMKADYVGFFVENKFIVGYGLDFNEKYRNFPYITCLED